MNKKIVVLGMITLFIFSGLGTYSITAKNTLISSQIADNKNIITEKSDIYPDLISETKYWIEEPPSGTRFYRYEITIKNIGDDIAIKPDGHPLFKWYTEYWYGQIIETYHRNKSLELLPGEYYVVDHYTDFIITGYGSKHIITVDPDDVVDEGIEGEKNNVEKFTVSRTRNRVIQTPFLNFLQSHPNLFPTLRLLLLQQLGK